MTGGDKDEGRGEVAIGDVPEATFDFDRARADIAAGRTVPKTDARRMLRTIVEASPASATAERRKLRGPPSVLKGALDGRADGLLAIVTVAKDHHAPGAARVRSRLGPTLFTADVPAGSLHGLLADPDVVSVELSAPLPTNGG